MKQPNYILKAFTHHWNLAFLFVMFALWVIGLPLILTAFILLLVQAGVLWVLPGVESFQRLVRQESQQETIIEARWFYMNQLWVVNRPHVPWWRSLMESGPISWEEHTPSRARYTDFPRLLEIRNSLVKLHQDRPDVVSAASLTEVEKNINNWLELSVAAQDAISSLNRLDRDKLIQAFKELREQRNKTKDPTTLKILSQKAKLIKTTLDNFPRLTLRAERSNLQADLIVSHLETYLTQALTARNSGSAVHLGNIADLHTGSEEEDAMLQLNAELGNFDASGDDPIWDVLAEELDQEVVEEVHEEVTA